MAKDDGLIVAKALADFQPGNVAWLYRYETNSAWNAGRCSQYIFPTFKAVAMQHVAKYNYGRFRLIDRIQEAFDDELTRLAEAEV